jgi:aconitate hydratase
MLEAVCGPCIGVGQAPSAGTPSVRTFNRNFPGRSGTQGDEVYLSSPSVAAATALAGRITDPRRLGAAPRIEPPLFDPASVDRHILDPPASEQAAGVAIVRGRSILPPPEPEPLPDAVEGKVLIVLEDDVSTGDMAPDGPLGMSLWSNIPECARYMFRRFDPDFHDRALSFGGGIVVAGHNYGQGSSREQAALGALQLGVRAVVAKGFARIHRQNLIGQGILPLVFARPEDHALARLGDTWAIADVRETVAGGGRSFACRTTSGHSIELTSDLLPRERQTLVAGGTIRYLWDPASG